MSFGRYSHDFSCLFLIDVLCYVCIIDCGYSHADEQNIFGYRIVFRLFSHRDFRSPYSLCIVFGPILIPPISHFFAGTDGDFIPGRRRLDICRSVGRPHGSSRMVSRTRPSRAQRLRPQRLLAQRLLSQTSRPLTWFRTQCLQIRPLW